MKRVAVILAGAIALATPAMAAAPVCLRVQDIVSTHSPDGKVLMVTLHDGTVWRNDLRGICPGLKFGGFKWVIRGPAEVCEFTQSLQVLQTGEICMLGKFTWQAQAQQTKARPTPAQPAKAP